MNYYIYQNPDCYDPNLTPEQRTEAKLNELRGARTGILTKTDWTQLPDTELTPEQVIECRTYRSEIRDLVKNQPNLDEIVFPTPPSYLII